jgi:hypothetical protein
MSIETADSLFKSGHHVDAIAIYEKSLIDIMEKIAVAHQTFGTHQRAVESWTRLIGAIDKNDINRISIALSNRGECRAMRNDLMGALADLNRSVSMAIRPANLNIRASIFCAMKQYELEMEDLQNAIAGEKNEMFLVDLRARQQANLRRTKEGMPAELHPIPRIYRGVVEALTLVENSVVYVRDATGKWTSSNILKTKIDVELADHIVALKLSPFPPELWRLISAYAVGYDIAHIHYNGWHDKWNEWINVRTDSQRFAMCPSFLRALDEKNTKYQVGVEVDIFPPHAIPRRWIRGKVNSVDFATGQVQVLYPKPGRWFYWFAVDSDEIYLVKSEGK